MVLLPYGAFIERFSPLAPNSGSMPTDTHEYYATESLPPRRATSGRFVLTFLVSFISTVGVLSLFNMVPSGFYDLPRQLYVVMSAKLGSPETAMLAALPAATENSVSPRTGTSTTTAPSSVAPATAPAAGGTGIDWPVSDARGYGLSIPSAGITAPIVIPADTNVPTLDEALARGVVHYPGSGAPGERSNVLLFGHSSHLPVVNNPAYKALNNLERVKLGDDIYLVSGATAYRYRVTAVRLTTAEEELISFSTERRMLTISTCNTFGRKEERFLVEAIFVGEVPADNAS